MKNIFLIVSIILSHAVSSFSQTDSIMYLKETDFSLYRMQKVKYESTGDIKTEKQLINLENVSALTFLSKDSLALTNQAEDPVYTRIADINEVSKYKYRLSPVLGITMGAVGGAIIGAITGYTVSGNDVNKNEPFWQLGAELEELEGAGYGALYGALGGAIIGGVITLVINHATLDLFSVPDKNKKAELIKFLRQK